MSQRSVVVCVQRVCAACVLQCVADCVAVCCGVLQCVADCVAVQCVADCVAVCCSLLQLARALSPTHVHTHMSCSSTSYLIPKP